MRLLTKKDTTFWVMVGDALVEIKPLTVGEVDRIRKKHTKTFFVRGEKKEEPDPIKIMQDMFCTCVVNWENIKDEEDNPIPCTPENKKLIAELNPNFASEVVAKATNLEETLNTEEVKNLKHGHAGTSATTA